MADSPFVIFQKIASNRRVTGSPRAMPTVKSKNRGQGQQISSVFENLIQEFGAVSDNTSGMLPERIIVFETAGSIANLIRALSQINGLEFQMDIETDDVFLSDEFVSVSKKRDGSEEEKTTVKKCLYMAATNLEALTRLEGLWRQYQRNKSASFESGLAPIKNLFTLLHDLRRWSAKDRIDGTGIVEYWERSIRDNEERNVFFEVELWYSKSSGTREERFRSLNDEVIALGGTCINQSVISEIAYHGVLVELKSSEVKKLVESVRNLIFADLISIESVMYFFPVGQIVFKNNLHEEIEESSDIDRYTPTNALLNDEPIIALFDGYPLTNHQLLQDRLIVYDPEDLGSTYSNPLSMSHGTGMSSLILHGDLEAGTPESLTRKILVRPVMSCELDGIRSSEKIQSNILLVDRFHIAFTQLFEGDSAIARTIKVVNISLGDPSHPFMHRVSAWARLLDWLSYKYKVLIIVSVGNFLDQIELSINNEEFGQLSQQEQSREIFSIINQNQLKHRLISPAESINSITVGSLHSDRIINLRLVDERMINPIVDSSPAAYSRFGYGINSSIKPDIYYDGGRALYDLGGSLADPALVEPLDTRHSRSGQRMAQPSPRAGIMNHTDLFYGTSNSTALVTRNVAIIYEKLLALAEGGEIAFSSLLKENIHLVLKALTINSAKWTSLTNPFDEIITGRTKKRGMGRFLGNGCPDFTLLFDNSGRRITLIAVDLISSEQTQTYRVPLPTSIGSKIVQRRISTTLAWNSPINPNLQKYRTAKITFELKDQELCETNINGDLHLSSRGTVQHKVFEGKRAIPIGEEDYFDIEVTCTSEVDSAINNLPYCLIVTIEVAEGIDVSVSNIFDEVRSKVTQRVPVQA